MFHVVWLVVLFKFAYSRARLKVAGLLGRASANHFQKASNQKMLESPSKTKGNQEKGKKAKRGSQGTPAKK